MKALKFQLQGMVHRWGTIIFYISSTEAELFSFYRRRKFNIYYVTAYSYTNLATTHKCFHEFTYV